MSKNISIRLEETLIKKLRESGNINKLSTKIQDILQTFVSTEYIRDERWMPHPTATYVLFFNSMNDKQIEEFGEIMSKEFEEFVIYENSDASVIEKLVMFGNFVSGPGGLVKKISRSSSYYDYMVDHKMGLNTSKAIFSVYKKISHTHNWDIANEKIDSSFLSFNIVLKDNS